MENTAITKFSTMVSLTKYERAVRLKDDALVAYATLIVVPYPGTFLKGRGWGCGACLIAAAYIHRACNNKLPQTFPTSNGIRVWAEEEYGLSEDAVSGLMQGFDTGVADNPALAADKDREGWSVGFQVGLSARKELLQPKGKRSHVS